MSEYSNGNSYQEILDRTLGHEKLETFDKREGSIAYNTLAPFAIELADIYQKLDILSEQSYLLTANGKNLDNRAYDFGISRIKATYAKRIGEFLDINGNQITPNIGSKFVPANSSSESEQIIFEYTGIEDGYYILTCKTAGTAGNTYFGELVALDFIASLAKARIIDTYTLANDDENDDSLRKRVQSSLTTKSFGGNISDYIEKIRSISGVGNVKIFPAWDDEIGSVLCSVVDGTYNPLTELVMHRIKEDLDPSDRTGEGVGLVPIGHKVTVTTPRKYNCDLFIKVSLQGGLILSDVETELKDILNTYFFDLRKTFAQDVVISVFRSRITEALLKSPMLVNVIEVLINGFDEDITLTDTAEIDGQYLPYVGEVIFEQIA
jgi:uncharacterized phage protein gp47/JayE